MKVLCLRFIDPATRLERNEAPWLNRDEEYVVLAVDVLSDKRVLLRIEAADDGTPALFDAEMFVTTSTSIPSNWRARVGEGGSIELAPEPWLRSGFWDDYFDRSLDAAAAYDNERDIIMRES